ncbi:MAG: family 16 glycosylhydrolase [Dysgonomonas sp.]
MKHILFFCSFLLLSLLTSAQTEDYQLVFSDDFEGNVLDESKWSIYTGYAPNQEKQYYTDGYNNLRLEDGNLVIVARKEQAVTNRDYTSARISSQGKGFIRYGKIEARINVPSGAGTWPAFWMMPEESVYGTWPYSGEIDIMEHIGSDPRMISHAVHTANKNGSKGNNWSNKQYKDDIENNFHVYSIIWDPDYINFYIDDVKSVTLWRNFAEDYKGWPFDQNFYVILNLALGGTMGGTIDDNIFSNPIEMKVDYVRLYAKNNSSIDGTTANNKIRVSSTLITNELTIDTNEPTVVSLFDLMGKLVSRVEVDGSKTISTDKMPKGIYLLKAFDETIKIMKQ